MASLPLRSERPYRSLNICLASLSFIYLENRKTYGRHVLEIKLVLKFSLQFFSEYISLFKNIKKSCGESRARCVNKTMNLILYQIIYSIVYLNQHCSLQNNNPLMQHTWSSEFSVPHSRIGIQFLLGS
jgi:hypothetical protein